MFSSGLAAQLRLLQTLYCVAASAMILLASGVALFAYRENSVLRVELAGRLEQANIARKEYVIREPILREFTQRLQSFAMNYRDFQRVITNHQAVISQFSGPSPNRALPATASPKR